MSAEVLREAAALMRERAEKVPAGPWEHGECDPKTPSEQRVLGQFSVIHDESKVLAPVPGFSRERKAFAEYAASWHPDVALAVAEWLDEEADDWTDADDGIAYYRAYLVATTYLGRDT